MHVPGSMTSSDDLPVDAVARPSHSAVRESGETGPRVGDMPCGRRLSRYKFLGDLAERSVADFVDFVRASVDIAE